MNSDTFQYENQGRSLKTLMAVLAVYALIAVLYSFGTLIWVLILLALFTIPAILDLVLNNTATFSLDDTHVHWKNRAQEGEVPFENIEKVRFDGRFDLSVRISLITTEGKKIKLPYDVLPPSHPLETAMKERGLRTERHPFTLL